MDLVSGGLGLIAGRLRLVGPLGPRVGDLGYKPLVPINCVLHGLDAPIGQEYLVAPGSPLAVPTLPVSKVGAVVILLDIVIVFVLGWGFGSMVRVVRESKGSWDEGDCGDHSQEGTAEMEGLEEIETYEPIGLGKDVQKNYAAAGDSTS